MSSPTSTSAPPPSRLRKAKGRGGETREEILAHAQRLFAAHGVHHISTRQIADAVGISQPTLYAYFPRKADLMEEVSVRAFRRISLLSEGFAADGHDLIEACIRAYVAFGLAEPDAYRIAFMIEGVHETEEAPQAHAQTAEAAAHAFDGLRRVMAERLGPGHPDLEVAAQSLWAAMHGLVSLLLARQDFSWVARDQLIDWHVRALALPYHRAELDAAPSGHRVQPL